MRLFAFAWAEDAFLPRGAAVLYSKRHVHSNCSTQQGRRCAVLQEFWLLSRLLRMTAHHTRAKCRHAPRSPYLKRSP